MIKQFCLNFNLSFMLIVSYKIWLPEYEKMIIVTLYFFQIMYLSICVNMWVRVCFLFTTIKYCNFIGNGYVRSFICSLIHSYRNLHIHTHTCLMYIVHVWLLFLRVSQFFKQCSCLFTRFLSLCCFRLEKINLKVFLNNI